MSKVSSFKKITNKHEVRYRGKDCMKKFVSFKRAGNEDN